MNNRSLSISDFDSICRICLTQKENMISYSTPQIISMIEECTSVQEPLNIKLPQQICDNCYWQLQISYQFKQQYVRSVEILCNIYGASEKCTEESEIIISIRDKLYKTSSFNKSQLINESTNILDSTSEQHVIVVKNEFNDSDLKIENSDRSVINAIEKQENKLHNFVAENQNCKVDAKKEETNTSDHENNPLFNSFYDSEEDNNNSSLVNDIDPLPLTNVTGAEERQKSLADILIIKYKIYDLTCNICGKELSTRTTLLRHMETHSKNRKFQYKCSLCNKGFYERGNLNSHLKRHEGNAKYKCEICAQRFYELNALALHNKYKHKAKSMKCPQCSVQFYHTLQLQQHEQTHKQKEHKCDVCGKVFQQKYKLRKHQITHSEVRQFTCKICNKGFKHKFTLTSHMKIRHENPNQRQMCFICGKLFVVGLAAHLESHDKDTTYKCERCNRVYTTRNGLQIHIKEKHINNPNKKRYTCEICDKSLGAKSSLTMHMKVVHSDARTSCHLCGKMYKTQKNVDAHVAAAHMDIRPFTCTICNKAFHRKDMLKIHMRSHTGERPYSCTICGKAFGYREVLGRHMQIHNK